MTTQTIDDAKVEQFVFQAVGELGATLNAALVVIGDRLGLYKAMAGAGALTSGELAERTGTSERCERFFRPGYRSNLVQSWILALDGVEAKLQAGARVADVGCGHGASTIIMGE